MPGAGDDPDLALPAEAPVGRFRKPEADGPTPLISSFRQGKNATSVVDLEFETRFPESLFCLYSLQRLVRQNRHTLCCCKGGNCLENEKFKSGAEGKIVTYS